MRSSLVSILTLAATTNAQDWGTTGSWTLITPSSASPPGPAYVAHNPTSFDGIVAFSGVDPASMRNTTWSYDVINNLFIVNPDLPGQVNAAYMFSNGGLELIVDEQNPNVIYALDTANPGGGWLTFTLTGGPTTRVGSRFMSWGSILYYFGGIEWPGFGPVTGNIHNDIYAVDLQAIIVGPTKTGAWVQVTPDNTANVPTPRIGYSWTGFDVHTVIYGGVTPPPNSDPMVCVSAPASCYFHDSVWFFAPGIRGLPTPGSINGNAWTILPASGAYGGPMPTRRFLHAAGSSGDQLFVFGGILSTGLPATDLWAFNLASTTWQQVQQTNPWPVAVRGTGTMLGRSFFLYVDDGKGYSSFWVWRPR